MTNTAQPTLPDEKIVELYLSRSERAVAETKEKYGGRLRNVSFNIVRDSGISEECENDTYLKAWTAIPPSEPRSYLFAFLARIIRNLSLNRLRSANAQKRQADYAEITEELSACAAAIDDTEQSVDEILLGELLSGFIRSLPDENRLLFMRRYWYLDSVSAAAKRIGISESNAKVRLFRLREQLKTHLEKEGYRL